MAHKHNDKRANIPTKELRDFVEDQEKNPKIVLYPRDPSLDPQLVWKGKDEQDSKDLAVPAVPVYIQEKIHPQAIIENLRSGQWSVGSGGQKSGQWRVASGEQENTRHSPLTTSHSNNSPPATRHAPQLSLFADFNGIKFEELIDFYHHEQNWANRFILGDSLLVMTSLAEKEGLKGKVQCIYFDPPYGINFGSNGSGGSSYFAFKFKGKDYYPSVGKGWLTTKTGLEKLALAGRIIQTGESIRYARHLNDFPCYEINNVWTDIASPPDVVYVVQTSTRVIECCLLMTTDPGDLVLGPTCGSGTTAFVAEQWGRRWITIDTSRVAIALARTRLMAAKFPYYLLADSPEGERKLLECGDVSPLSMKFANQSAAVADALSAHSKVEGDIKRGFVYKRVPHVTLKSIANNPDIKEGMSREEIDRAIAKHADTELLYDQPYEDNKRIRVTGPFTVESLSPHRVLSDEWPVASGQEDKTGHSPLTTTHSFVAIILENLRKAGVQNTLKNERINFESLEPYAGVWIHAAGTVSGKWSVASDEQEKTSHSHRVAVSIGPEHGTVGPELLKEAAKEAVQGVGFDLLIVCGFAFDPHVSEETKRHGKLTVLPARMNPDLAMGDELLKKTGAGNLFMVFGEPDVRVESGEWLVDRNGRMLMRYDNFKVLSGIDGLAEIRGLGREGLSSDAELSKGGNLRAGQSDAASSGFDSLEHRRGRSAELHRRISAVSRNSKGKSGRTGNAGRTGDKAEVSAAESGGAEQAECAEISKMLNGLMRSDPKPDH